MRNLSHLSSFRLAVAIVLSLSLITAASSYSFPPKQKTSLQLSLSSPSPSPFPAATPNATAGDILSLLGTAEQASQVDPDVARQLRSCFRFLVPFNGRLIIDSKVDQVKRSPMAAGQRSSVQRRENEDERRILEPPDSVMRLARLAAVDAGRLRAAMSSSLDVLVPVPDVEGSYESHCEPAGTSNCSKFLAYEDTRELEAYMISLFDMIVSRGPSVELDVSLNRYDLFHGHFFLANDTGRLGILFHAKEYPVSNGHFGNQGACETGSNVDYNENMMNLRNILWLAPLLSRDLVVLKPGVLVVLDAHRDGIIYRDIINYDVDEPSVRNARTIDQAKFGWNFIDVNYLNVGGIPEEYQIYMCRLRSVLPSFGKVIEDQYQNKHSNKNYFVGSSFSSSF